MSLVQAFSKKRNLLAPRRYTLRTILLTTMILSQGHYHNPYAQYYPSNWPANPFHAGEVKLQQQANVQTSVMSYAPRVIRPYLPQQHLDFYQQQPFMVAAALDSNGYMWSTLLTSPTGQADWVKAVSNNNKKNGEPEQEDYDPTKLLLEGGPVPGDALYGKLQTGSDLGLLGIEFATKRRNRVNGRIIHHSSSGDSGGGSTPGTGMVFQVDQAFGNCPQYIKPRQWWSVNVDNSASSTNGTINKNNLEEVCRPLKQQSLTPEQSKVISNAETIFLATGYRGEGEDVRFGNDASHRGGPPGFIMVQDEHTLVLPDFSGNNHFNTLGNLELDHRMGITLPDFERGGLLQLSGYAQVDLDRDRAARTYPGALRLITFHIQQVNVVPPGSLPIRWSSSDADLERPLEITSIVQESENVKSFYLRPLPQDTRPLWGFQAGQHLPVRLVTSEGGEIWRTYSLSGSPSADYYRISVKREFLGLASRILHDQMHEGDVLEVNAPAGDFLLRPSSTTTSTSASDIVLLGANGDEKSTPDPSQTSVEEEASTSTLVLLSAGIGITPVLSMLHKIVDTSTSNTADTQNRQRVIWIHGARDGAHHPLREEVQALQHRANVSGENLSVETHVRYSQPHDGDTELFDSQGRVDVTLLRSILAKPEELQNADYYFCGPGSFTSDMEGNLEALGVNPSRIHFESF